MAAGSPEPLDPRGPGTLNAVRQSSQTSPSEDDPPQSQVIRRARPRFDYECEEVGLEGLADCVECVLDYDVCTEPETTVDVLQNDGLELGDSAMYEEGFIDGDVVVPCFDTGPRTVLGLQMFWGGGCDGTSEELTFSAYAAGGDGTSPSSVALEWTYTVISSASARTYVPTPEPVSMPGPFCLGVHIAREGLPAIGYDEDGTVDAGNNGVGFSGDWFQTSECTSKAGFGVRRRKLSS